MANRSLPVFSVMSATCLVLAACGASTPAPEHQVNVTAAPSSRAPECTSLLGTSLYAPEKSATEKAEAEQRLAEAKAALDAAPDDKEKVIWYGRMLAGANHFRQAEEYFEGAAKRFPDDSRMYRHLGHRQVTLRRFKDAIATLKKGVELAKNEPDSPEPTAKPGGAQLDTAHQNIFYHLGIACFLTRDYANAESAFQECYKLSANPDSLCSATHWLYMTLRREGKDEAAAKVLEKITPDLVVLENHAYHDLCRLYRGELDGAEHFSKLDPKTVDYPTFGFGYANLELVSGRRDRAVELCKTIVANSSEVWMAFGCMGCEAELSMKR